MKQLLLAIFVFLASMPSQASCADMHAPQEGSRQQHETMMQHAGMDHSGMNHAEMNMTMDCCDHDQDNPTGQCDPVSQCRTPAFSYVMFDATTVNEFAIPRQHHTSTDASPKSSQFHSPPLRPPIS